MKDNSRTKPTYIRMTSMIEIELENKHMDQIDLTMEHLKKTAENFGRNKT